MFSQDESRQVIVVGAGLAGLATALGAALHGLRVCVLESAALVGGAAAYSGGQVWVGANHVARREGIEDDLDRAEKYVRHLAHSHPEVLDEGAMKRWLSVSPQAMRYWEDVGAISWTVIPGLIDYHAEADGALGVGRYLTNQVIDGSVLGEWRDRLRVSPYFPVGTTYADMATTGRRVNTTESEPKQQGERSQAFGVSAPAVPTENAPDSADPLTFGTGVVASFLARLLEEQNVEILLEHEVTALMRDDDGLVIGARAEHREEMVERFGPVVLATSSYDWNPDLVREFLGLDSDNFGSIAPASLTGAGITLARSVGGAVAVIPATSVPMLPGWGAVGGTGGYGPEFAKPHSMIVDRTGNRFCNDSYWVDLVEKALNPDEQHLPFFLIWDEQHRLGYGLGGTPPGGQYPDGLVTSAPTLTELGDLLGIDSQQLEKTAQVFSEHAERGEDPLFGRGTSDYVHRFYGDQSHQPNSVLGPISEPPFHGMRLKFMGTGIGSSGVHIDSEGHVLDEAGSPVPGLWAVGSVAALTTTGTGYNSGFALGRGLTLAYQVTHELAGIPIG
jgi:3-oxosteroid 1-dehydrogenase